MQTDEICRFIYFYTAKMIWLSFSLIKPRDFWEKRCKSDHLNHIYRKMEHKSLLESIIRRTFTLTTTSPLNNRLQNLLESFISAGRHFRTVREWSTRNWRFEVWFNNTLKSNTIICKKLATIVSDQKNVVRPFVKRKQVSKSAKI